MNPTDVSKFVHQCGIKQFRANQLDHSMIVRHSHQKLETPYCPECTGTKPKRTLCAIAQWISIKQDDSVVIIINT